MDQPGLRADAGARGRTAPESGGARRCGRQRPGQTMWLEAFRAWHDVAGGPPCRITVLLEGEEEVGTDNLLPFLAANAAALQADAAVISDTGMWDIDTPALTTRLRGIVYTAGDAEGGEPRSAFRHVWRLRAEPDQCADAHPGRAARCENGRVQLPGFYEGVADVSTAQARNGTRWGSMRRRCWRASACPCRWANAAGRVGPAMGAADRGHQRHLGRLSGRRAQDGDRGGGIGQGVVPAGHGAGARTRSTRRSSVSSPTRAPADAKIEIVRFSADPAVEVPVDNPLRDRRGICRLAG